MKVVINRCYGGFGLSAKAMKYLYALKNIPCFQYEMNYDNRKYVMVEGDDLNHFTYFFDVKNFQDLLDENPKNEHELYSSHSLSDSEISRTDLELIKTVEDLGILANSKYSKLEIIEIPDDVEWEISEYDGLERIEECHRSWI